MVLKSLLKKAPAINRSPRKVTKIRRDPPVREEHPPAQENVRPVPSQTFEALQKRSVDAARAKLVDELVIVDRQLLSISRNGTLNVPGCHDLLVSRRWVCRFDRMCCSSPIEMSPRLNARCPK